MSHDNKHMTEQIKRRIVGATISTALGTKDGESFGFRVITKDGNVLDCWVDQDAEGNGPGWLDIQKAGVL